MPVGIFLDDFAEVDQDVSRFLDNISSHFQGSGIEGDAHEHRSAELLPLAGLSDFENVTVKKSPTWGKANLCWHGEIGSRGADVLSTDGADRAESRTCKLREQNRLAQARFRLKTKQKRVQLEKQILQLTAALASWRATKHEQQVQNSQLMERSYAAASALLDLSIKSRLTVMVEDGTPAPLSSAPASISAPVSSVVACRGCRRKVPLTCGPPCPRMVSSHSQHAILSCAELVASSGGLSMAEMVPNLGMHLRVIRATLAARKGCRAGDVCWHLPSIHCAAPGLLLSFSAQLGSPECTNSFLICWLLDVLECAFLTEERDDLTALMLNSAQAMPQAPPGGSVGPVMSLARTAHAVCASPVGASQPEEPCCPDVIGAQCRCGVNQTCAVAAAIPHALLGLLAKYAHRVPERAFFLRCDQFQRFVDSMQPRIGKPSASAAAEVERADEPGQVPMQAIVEGMNAVLECMATAHSEAMVSYRASPERVVTGHGQKPEAKLSAAMARNNADLSLLGDTHCFALQTLCLESKKRIREIALAVCIPSHLSFCEIEHMNVVTYKALGVSWEQACAMRSLLRRVKQHRSAINAQYVALATALAANPSAAAAPPDFLPALMTLCMPPTATSVAVAENPGIGAGFAGARPLSKHEWARHMLGASTRTTSSATFNMEKLWSTLEDELTAQTTFAWMLFHAPYLSKEQAARFSGELLAQGTYVVDKMRMCQLAVQDLQRGLLFEGKLCELQLEES